jgi:hypothetical protein
MGTGSERQQELQEIFGALTDEDEIIARHLTRYATGKKFRNNF